MECPKCGATSGDDWSQCVDVCPMPGSPYYSEDAWEIGRMNVASYDDYFVEFDNAA